MRRIYARWIFALLLIAILGAAVQSGLEERRLDREAKLESIATAASLEEPATTAYETQRYGRLARIVDRLRASQAGFLGIALCPEPGAPKPAVHGRHHVLPPMDSPLGLPSGAGWEALCNEEPTSSQSPSTWTTRVGPRKEARLLLIQDRSRLRGAWLEAFLRAFALLMAVFLILLGLIAAEVRGWVRSYAHMFRSALQALLSGKRPRLFESAMPNAALRPFAPEFDKLATKIRSLIYSAARGAVNPGAPTEADWLTRLRDGMDRKRLIVIANREPYIHQRKEGRIEVVRPASGLVTALEPILRECGGLWIAHGGGSADRETVDAQNELTVPPGPAASARYKLRRVWLTEEEENGYYYGFSNEGLWPLCHLAHTRPIFRLSDFEAYRTVNQIFADAVPESAIAPFEEDDEGSVVLVQDYHFALLPRLLKNRALAAKRPGPKVGLFWHIPWPNPEAFGICPWSQELLRGMLGADVIGFHTQYHCNNFLETCNRYLEARIDNERFSVTMENHETLIRAFPIGIATPPVRYLNDDERVALKGRYGIRAKYVAVGVDRLDYTKGLVERIEAVGRFLEKHPEYVGQFTLIQMGSPSRSQIPAYQRLVEQVHETAKRVCSRFAPPPGTNPENWAAPVMLLPVHHEWDEIQYFYQLGDVCMVTSLHDGMNLVAKEYVWCQRPDRGSLILSKFTGASRELSEAFVVNPYSTEEMAEALFHALSLMPEERARRMNAMRGKVESHNAYHWATDLIHELIRSGEALRTQAPLPTPGVAVRTPPLVRPDRRGRSKSIVVA